MRLFGKNNSQAAQTAPQQFDSYLDVFKSGNYEKATIQQRMDAFQALEHDMAMAQGRPERQVVFEDMQPSTNGSISAGVYNPSDDRLHLNSDYLRPDGDQFDGMNTVIHEGRHAYQYDCMNGECQPDSKLAPHINSMKLEDLPNRNGEGVVYDREYMRNPSELDAYSYANDMMHSFESHFKGDEAFAESCRVNDKAFSGEIDQMSRITRGNALDTYQRMDDAKATLNNPDASYDEKMAAYNDYNQAADDYKNILNDNYDSNRNFDIYKSGDSHAKNTAAEFGYSDSEIDSVMNQDSAPTLAQQSTYINNNSGNPPDVHPENYSLDQNLQDRNSTGQESGGDSQSDGKGHVMPVNNELNGDEQNNEQSERQEQSTDGQQAGTLPEQNEEQEQSTDGQQAGALPEQNEEQEQSADEQQAGALPEQNEEQEQSADGQQAGALPGQNEEQNNAQGIEQPQANYVDADAQQDEGQDSQPHYVDADQEEGNGQSPGNSMGSYTPSYSEGDNSYGNTDDGYSSGQSEQSAPDNAPETPEPTQEGYGGMSM